MSNDASTLLGGDIVTPPPQCIVERTYQRINPITIKTNTMIIIIDTITALLPALLVSSGAKIVTENVVQIYLCVLKADKKHIYTDISYIYN